MCSTTSRRVAARTWPALGGALEVSRATYATRDGGRGPARVRPGAAPGRHRFGGALVRRPRDDRSGQRRGTANVLAAAAAAGARRVVLASSCAVYGAGGELPSRRRRPHSPSRPTRRRNRRRGRAGPPAGVTGSIPVCCASSTSTARRQDPSSRVLGRDRGLHGAVSGGRPCTVYGDGGQTRDFVLSPTWWPPVARHWTGAPLEALPVNVGTGSRDRA